MIRCKKFAIIGVVLMILSIIFGAFGAHALKEILEPAQLTSYNTATSYLTTHGLAFIALSIIRADVVQPSKVIFYGLLVFSGSIYMLLLLGLARIDLPGIGLITPVGGLTMIVGWSWLLIKVIRAKEHHGSSK
jgi:uncharacterized membrane protein YgdD (TMEM256/DUF423 family)